MRFRFFKTLVYIFGSWTMFWFVVGLVADLGTVADWKVTVSLIVATVVNIVVEILGVDDGTD